MSLVLASRSVTASGGAGVRSVDVRQDDVRLAGLRLAAERAGDGDAVERLVDRAFGPGRFAKTAERLREGNRVRLDLSVCAWRQDEIVGSVRLWPISIGATPAVLLGPIAVEIEARRNGLGAALVGEACESAFAAGESLVLLVGDAPLFEPLGFMRVEAGRVQMPGPVDPARVFWRPLAAGALEGVGGAVRVRRSA